MGLIRIETRPGEALPGVSLTFDAGKRKPITLVVCIEDALALNALLSKAIDWHRYGNKELDK